jgi:hypothetical protein
VLGHFLSAPGPEPRPLPTGHDDGKHKRSSSGGFCDAAATLPEAAGIINWRLIQSLNLNLEFNCQIVGFLVDFEPTSDYPPELSRC